MAKQPNVTVTPLSPEQIAELSKAAPTGPVKFNEVAKEILMTEKVGKFLVINTARVQGQRYNLEKVRTYGKNDVNSVQLVWDNGLSTILEFDNSEQADKLVARIDEYCL